MSELSKAHRFLVSLRMQAREYKHRLAILFVVLMLPVAFWVSTYYTAGESPMPVEVPTYSGTEEMMVPQREGWPSVIGLMGTAWAVGVAAFYSLTGSVRKDKRLVLCGYKALEILGARLILLIGIDLFVSIVPIILFVPTISPLNPEVVWLSSFLAGLIGIQFGLFIGALIPRPTEGTLIIIAFFGISMSVGGDAARFFPTYPANQLLFSGLFAENPLISPFVVDTLLIFFILAVLIMGLWSYRVRIQRW